LLFLIIFAANQEGKIDIRTPKYVTQRGGMVAEVTEVTEVEKQDV
jgi:hypothetical protein